MLVRPGLVRFGVLALVACNSDKPAPKKREPLPPPIPVIEKPKPPPPKRPTLPPCTALVPAKYTSGIPIQQELGEDGTTFCSFSMVDTDVHGGSVTLDCEVEPLSDQRVSDITEILAEITHATPFDFERAAIRRTNVSIIFIDKDMPGCKVSVDFFRENPDIDALAKHVAATLKP